MKNITLNSLRLANTGVPTFARQNPAPFPGKYPTHLAWSCSFEGKTQSYIGKPTVQAVCKFFAASVRKEPWLPFDAWITEFDRVHPHILLWTNRFGLMRHPQVWSFYHPWVGYNPDFGHFKTPWVLKEIAGHKVYSPFRALRRERQQNWWDYVNTNFPGLKLKPLTRPSATEELEGLPF